MMKTFRQFLLNEAVPVSDYRKIIRKASGNNNIAKAVYDEIFDEFRQDWQKNSNRIYLRVPEEKAPKEFRDALRRAGFKVVSWQAGTATKDGKNIVRIGKILSRLGDKDLLERYAGIAERHNSGKKTSVCISRHPYDLCGMTSGRRWSEDSCMNLDNFDRGGNSRHVVDDIRAGTLIAYEISVDDPGLKDPFGRVLIKPFLRVSGSGQRHMAVREGKSYGHMSEAALRVVDKFIDKINSGLSGVFTAHPDIYKDVLPDNIVTKDILRDYIQRLRDAVLAGTTVDTSDLPAQSLFAIIKANPKLFAAVDNPPEEFWAWLLYSQNERNKIFKYARIGQIPYMYKDLDAIADDNSLWDRINWSGVAKSHINYYGTFVRTIFERDDIPESVREMILDSTGFYDSVDKMVALVATADTYIVSNILFPTYPSVWKRLAEMPSIAREWSRMDQVQAGRIIRKWKDSEDGVAGLAQVINVAIDSLGSDSANADWLRFRFSSILGDV